MTGPPPSTVPPGRRWTRRARSSCTSRASAKAPASTPLISLAVVDAEYGRIVRELPMPNVGDELHHFGRNRCSSACHGADRSHLIVPGFGSSRIHVINVADDPRAPRLEKVIEPEEIIAKTGYTPTTHRPLHAVVTTSSSRCSAMPTATAPVASSRHRRPDFEVKRPLGAWRDTQGLNYDFSGTSCAGTCSCRPSSVSRTPMRRASTPTTCRRGPVRRAGSTSGISPSARWIRPSTSVRPASSRWMSCWQHDPDSRSRALSAQRSRARCGTSTATTAAGGADQVIAVEAVEVEGWPFPVPGLITDLVLSMDDRWLYFANWLHGDVRQCHRTQPRHG